MSSGGTLSKAYRKKRGLSKKPARHRGKDASGGRFAGGPKLGFGDYHFLGNDVPIELLARQ